MTNTESWNLNNRHLLPKVLEAGSQIKVSVDDWVSGEAPLPRLQTAAFWLCPHIGGVGVVVRRERDMLVSLPLQIRTLIPSGAHPHDLF